MEPIIAIIVIAIVGLIALRGLAGEGSFSFLDHIIIGPKSIGRVGEARVSRRLRRLAEEEYKVFNNITILDYEGKTTQIDHVVVSMYGIFVIETKCYKGWIFGDEKSHVWSQTLYSGRGWWSKSEKHKFQNPIRQNWRHIYVLSEQLKMPRSYFHNIVVFAGDAEAKTKMPDYVMDVSDVARYIRSFKEPVISSLKRDMLAHALEVLAALVTSQEKSSHVKNLQRSHTLHVSVDEKAQVPKCPKCGSLMRRRQRRKDGAPFYGCSRYPSCNGIINIA